MRYHRCKVRCVFIAAYIADILCIPHITAGRRMGMSCIAMLSRRYGLLIEVTAVFADMEYSSALLTGRLTDRYRTVVMS